LLQHTFGLKHKRQSHERNAGSGLCGSHQSGKTPPRPLPTFLFNRLKISLSDFPRGFDPAVCTIPDAGGIGWLSSLIGDNALC
jgi:hypothetical protein